MATYFLGFNNPLVRLKQNRPDYPDMIILS